MSNSSIYTNFSWDGPCLLDSTYFFSEDYARTLFWSDFDTTFLSAVVPTVTVLGVITNGSFLYVVAKIQSMRTITNLFLANLAAADMLLLLAVVIQGLVWLALSSGVAYNAYPGGPAFCSFYAISRETLYLVSIALITLVTRERFYAICYPLKHRMVAGKRRAVRLIVGAWLGGTAYGVFIALNFLTLTTYCVEWPRTAEFSGLPRVVGFCLAYLIPKEIAVFTVDLVSTLPFAISLALTSFMYLQIYQALSRRPVRAAEKDDAKSCQAPNSADHTRRHVARMLLTNTVIFFVCNFPAWLKVILELVDYFTGSDYGVITAVRLWQIANIMALVNSTVNPIVYNATNPRYRQAFQEAFSVGLFRQRSANITTQSVSMTSVTHASVSSIGPTAAPKDSNI